MQKDKEDRELQLQQQKIYDVVLNIQNQLPRLIDQLNQDLSQKVV